ncbi:hypothetical protein PHISP_08080 [Aspergillus sp. HF37]|nr:hypothetical protein PHISP_08080 [Aspergillus sp. HF37]
MSVIDDYVCCLDAQLDDLWQHALDRLHHGDISLDNVDPASDPTPQIAHLQGTVRSLSAVSKLQPLLRLERLLSLLSQSCASSRDEPRPAASDAHAEYVSDLRWLVAAKAAVQMLRSVLRIFLDRSLVLSEEIAYWEEVQSSPWYTGLSTVQTSPVWLWQKLREGYCGCEGGFGRPGSMSLISEQWARFYHRLRRCVLSQSACGLRRGIPSLVAKKRSDVRQKKKVLRAMKTRYTSSIGFLVQECLVLWMGGTLGREGYELPHEQWRSVVLKSAALMEKIVMTTGETTPDFDETTLAAIEQEAGPSRSQDPVEPGSVTDQLADILRSHLPNSLALSKASINSHGRPSWLTRYWVPFAFGFFTASTFTKVWVSQRARVISWVMDIGSTTVRFWGNWVVEPVEKLVKTIRHDEGSEIALMSKNSLEADRASLERMVVDFVVDRDSSGQAAGADMEVLASKVREGDLTPVLKAYERDLRAPFSGTVRGDLVRALLIQIQKTKVDVEVAISGIDSLLKSQELVFGFVGLTPGILVSYAVFRWALGLVGNRKGLRLGRRHDELKYALRNVHRTLTASRTADEVLSYQDHGVLLCDTETLLHKGRETLGRADRHEFQKDIRELVDVRQGVERQLQVVERMRWGYTRGQRLG